MEMRSQNIYIGSDRSLYSVGDKPKVNIWRWILPQTIIYFLTPSGGLGKKKYFIQNWKKINWSIGECYLLCLTYNEKDLFLRGNKYIRLLIYTLSGNQYWSGWKFNSTLIFPPRYLFDIDNRTLQISRSQIGEKFYNLNWVLEKNL